MEMIDIAKKNFFASKWHNIRVPGQYSTKSSCYVIPFAIKLVSKLFFFAHHGFVRPNDIVVFDNHWFGRVSDKAIFKSDHAINWTTRHKKNPLNFDENMQLLL